MTKDELVLKLTAEKCKKSLYEFLKTLWNACDTSKFIDGWLLEYLCECFMYACRYYIPDKYKSWWMNDDEWSKIEGVCPIRDEGWKNNHNIEMPPRHSKSKTLNVMGCCWLATIAPIKVASVSHSQRLSRRMNQDRQMIFNSDIYKRLFPEVKLIQNTSESITMGNGNVLYSISQEGFTGFGADVIVNDDLTTALTSAKDGERQETAKRYLTDTMPSRLNDQLNGVIFNIQQRLAPNDVTGFIRSNPELKATYTFDVLQAINEKDDFVLKFPCSGKTINIAKGDYLWWERFRDYSSLKAQQGERVFQTQYQQNPITSDMVVFQPNWFRIDNEINLNDYYLQYSSYDLPVKDKEKSDFAGIVLAKIINGKLVVYDALEEHMAFNKSKAFIKRVRDNNRGIIQIVEDKANGSAIIQNLGSEIEGIVAFNPGSKSKVVRAELAAIYVENGNVIFTNTESPGMKNLLRRLTEFPLVDHDDVVDAFTQLVLYVFNDVKYSVYGNSFNELNVVKNYNELASIDYAVVKEGDLFKIAAVAIDYQKDTYTLVREWFLKDIDEVVEVLSKARIVYDASPANEVSYLFNGRIPIAGNYFDFQESVNLLSYGFSKKNVRILDTCTSSIGEIQNFKWEKNALDEGKERYASTDGIGACLRIVVAHNKGINGVFY